MSAAPLALEALARNQRFDNQISLVGEHWRSCRHLWLNTPEPLRTARLGDDLSPHFWFDTGLPGLAPVTARSHRFEFSGDGKPALIVPAYDGIPGMLDATPERHVEELRDLVAVDLDRPDRFWRRRGEALVLGNAFLEIAGQEGEPLPVYRNPLSWLRSGGAGIVVLDWIWARELLLDHQLIAEDLLTANRLEGSLKPRIWVEEAAA